MDWLITITVLTLIGLLIWEAKKHPTGEEITEEDRFV